jgi:predicted DNA-binding protein
MKYQIYLKKETSELINAVAKASNKKSSTFLKEFIEECFGYTAKTIGETTTEKVRAYGREETKDEK